MYLQMFIAWSVHTTSSQQTAWASKHGVVLAHMKHFAATAQYLVNCVTTALNPETSTVGGGYSSNNAMNTKTKGVSSDWSIDTWVKSLWVSPATAQAPGLGSNVLGQVVLGPHRLNLLRLILTWTSEGHLLRQKRKAIKNVSEVHTVPVFMQPELTSDHCLSLIPRTLPWKLESKVRNINNLSRLCYQHTLTLLHITNTPSRA